MTRRTYTCRYCGLDSLRKIDAERRPCQCGAHASHLMPKPRAKAVGRRGAIKTATPVVRQLLGLIEAAGWTHHDVTSRFNFGANQVSVWRRGLSDPSLRSIEAVADALGYEMRLVKKEARSALSEGQ